MHSHSEPPSLLGQTTTTTSFLNHLSPACHPPSAAVGGGDEEEEEGIDDERCVSVTDCDCPLGRVAGLVALLKWFSIKSVSCCYSYDYDRYVGEWTISS